MPLGVFCPRDVLALLDVSKSHGPSAGRFRLNKSAAALTLAPSNQHGARAVPRRHQLLKLRAKNPELFKVG